MSAILEVKAPDLPVAPPLPAEWDPAADQDWRIYACVIGGRILQGLAIAGVLGCTVCVWVVAPACVLLTFVPLTLWAIGEQLVRARICPDDSLYVPGFTTLPYIEGQPAGLYRQGFNCCINAATQVALESGSVNEFIDEYEELHPLKVARQQYRQAQVDHQPVAEEVNTQTIRPWVASKAPAPLEGQAPIIARGCFRQEDAGEIINIILNDLSEMARRLPVQEGAQPRVPAFIHRIIEQGYKLNKETCTYEPIDAQTHPQTRLLLGITSYLQKKAAGQIPAGLSDEQIFLQYIMQPYFSDQIDGFGPMVRKFEQAPEDLFIQANRFTWFQNAGKINNPIPFPYQFTMPADYIENSDGQPCTYRAKAFFVHIGAGANSGHYVAYISTIGPNGEELWWRVDDAHVMPIYAREAHAARQKAYNILYRRVHA